MKRVGNLFEKIWNKKNIYEAHITARKKKRGRNQVMRFDDNLCEEVNKLSDMIKNKTYKVSEYKIDERKERGKVRVIFKLPYNPDRVIHHALLQIIEPILAKTYIKDTYQSIKGRGTRRAKRRVESMLKDKENAKYCLKIDIMKFYPNVDNRILKQLIRRKIKCKDTLELIDILIDSTEGLPIGNYPSQTFGNFYLSYLDHFIKEVLKVKKYVRYADDMIFLCKTKEELHFIKEQVVKFLKEKLNLELKSNYQIFPTFIRGIDYLGFRFFNGFTLIRKTIKKSIIKLLSREANEINIRRYASYYGWIKITNSYNFIRKYITKGIIADYQRICDRIKIRNPMLKIKIKPKIVNKYGNYQPTLFNFM